MKSILKKPLMLITLLTLTLALCSCGERKITETVWENNEAVFKITLEFSDNIMTLTPTLAEGKTLEETGMTEEKLAELKETYYYIDCKGEEDNRYIRTFKTEEDFKAEQNGDFLPYYIKDDVLYMNGIAYTPVSEK